ncbi:hypothetical protein QOL99_00840 [Deinococcus sp. MIMF12]|uniref:Uncharacterized protein n=1 Tax=Deinococcus rhizophilus TaxID=3049544 RepID=A0ABT7JCD0_9DEIO|nr:hypothetical protein [Deinococcus rhizophilus]MDL2342687.1 hypothetical protein [Deinococcus rhizophilus]
MSTEPLQPLDSALAAPLLRGLRDVMARHGALTLRARAGQTGHLALGAGGMVHPVALHLTWAHPDDLSRLRQAAALPAEVKLEGERDEMTFYADLLMALLRVNVGRAEVRAGKPPRFRARRAGARRRGFRGRGHRLCPPAGLTRHGSSESPRLSRGSLFWRTL